MPKFSVRFTGKQYRDFADKIPVSPMTMKDDDQLTVNYNLDLGSWDGIKALRFLRLMQIQGIKWKAEELDEESVYILAEMGRLLVDLLHAQKEKIDENDI